MKPSVVILTGAGISAESGLSTFRGADGLWEGHAVEDVATPEAFERNPKLVHQFYNMRRAALDTVEPNAAHLALARLQREYPGKVTLITQNVDDLHERGGSTELIHMHGELRRYLCNRCEASGPWSGDLTISTACPSCQRVGGIRPDIVWFGEMPYRMDEIDRALRKASIFATIGSSGLVYPAAGFVMTARFAGAKTVELNQANTAISMDFTERRIGAATTEVPRWVDELLGT